MDQPPNLFCHPFAMFFQPNATRPEAVELSSCKGASSTFVGLSFRESLKSIDITSIVENFRGIVCSWQGYKGADLMGISVLPLTRLELPVFVPTNPRRDFKSAAADGAVEKSVAKVNTARDAKKSEANINVGIKRSEAVGNGAMNGSRGRANGDGNGDGELHVSMGMVETITTAAGEDKSTSPMKKTRTLK